MELSAFVAARTKAAPKKASFASTLLATETERVSELIEQWRATSNRALPLTYAEFCKVLAGNLKPSESILQAWDRMPLNRHRPDSPDLAAYVKQCRDDLSHYHLTKYESEARHILTRFSAEPASPKLYAMYLATASRDARKAFFRRWAMPFPEGKSVAHGYICAGSGHGKSEVIKALVYERVRREEGVVVFDPHGDMVQQIARWPEVARSGRLVYLDPLLAGKEGFITPVINPIEIIQKSEYKDAAVSSLVKCLQRVIDQSELSQRMETLLRTVLPAIAKKPGASLLDLRDAMGNPKKPGAEAMREFLAAHAEENAVNAEFIREDLKEGDYNNTRVAIRSRLQYLFSSTTFKHCLTGPSTIKLRQEIDRGAIILVDLSANMGDGVAEDWGKFLLSSLFAAAMSRQDIVPAKRRPCFAYIDEADTYLNESVRQIYQYTRKYGLFITVAQQVPDADKRPEISKQVFSNSRIVIAGNSGDPDSAKRLSELTGAPVGVIQDLRQGEFVFKVESTLQRASVRRDLRNFTHSISNEEWEAVKADQIKRYYHDHRNAPSAPIASIPGIEGALSDAELQARRATE